MHGCTPLPGTGGFGRGPVRLIGHGRRARTNAASATSRRTRIAGRTFVTWSAFEAHLEEWTREIADQRVHGAGGYTRRADQNFVIITRNGEDYRADFMAFIQPDDTIRVYERYLFANGIEFNGDFQFDGERLGRWRVSENRHPTQ
jgi:hypothetical protein